MLDRAISSQRYLDEMIVAAKSADGDYVVTYAPVSVAGEEYVVVIDGHHSLAAARADGADIEWTAAHVELLRHAERDPESFLAAHHFDSDYYFLATGRSVW